MRAVVLVAAVACLALQGVAAAQAPDPHAAPAQAGATSGDGAAAAHADVTLPGGDAGPDGPPPAAGSGGRPTRQTRTVKIATTPCQVVPGTNYSALLQDEVRVPPGAWQVVRTYCAGELPPAPAPPQPDPVVAEAVAVSLRAEVRAPRPRVQVQPAGGVLVHQPGIVHLADPGPPPTARDADPLVPGLTIVVSLGQPTYEWSWGDGTSASSGSSRGRAYADGDDVPDEGRGAPLVSHTWSAPGTRTASVTAVYPATWSWNGTGGTLAPVRATSSFAVAVTSARSELVSR